MDVNQQLAESAATPELYFLISKFLSAGPLQETSKVLIQELEKARVLPKRTDWLGQEHEQSFAELARKYSHIDSNHLLQICCRIGPILDKELTPSVPGLTSLLGAGRQSLLRTRDSVYRSRSLLDYCSRIHGVSLPDSAVTKPIHNFERVILGREYGGPVRRKLLVPTNFYSKTKLLRRTVGHLSSVYCVLFDRTGRYIITGADDLLIKIWSSIDGRLLATLRGASAEITDIAINLDNTMLAAGSLDRILRVWDLQTTSPIAVLSSHTGMITSVNFCPSPRGDLKYLVTTSTDGSIAFWQYTTPRGQKVAFAPKPIQYHEKLRPGQAQMMCTSFSPGGMFLAAGSADHHVRVYLMSEDGPKRILETEAYTDAVDSVQWSHRGLRFISGSKDGTAHIWSFESQQWKSVKLCMTEKLSTCPEPEEGKKLKVTMVAWDCSDKYVITAVNDFTIKIWNSKTANLHCVLRGHKDELFVLESNPKDEFVLLSAGHDGQLFLWDIESGVSVAHFINNIDGQGHGSVFDAKWSPDGTMIAATDSHGHMLIFGLGIGPDKYKLLPVELFFHTDYRPLLRDASHHVVDEQTQIMPHLMPPPFLVDSDGNPHPAKYQKYVPGRENCTTDQLIPNLTVGADGVIIDDNAANAAASNYSHIDRLIAVLANRQGNVGGSAAVQNHTNSAAAGSANRSQLDRMIEALANRQGRDQAPDSNNRATSRRSANASGNDLNNSGSASLDRGSVDPPNNSQRQGTTWGRPPEQQVNPTVNQLKYVRRIYVRPMKYSQLQSLKQTVYSAGQYEMQEYKREMRRRPIMISTASTLASQSGNGRQRNTRTNGVGRVCRRRTARAVGNQARVQSQPVYRTRAVRDQEIMEQPTPPPDESEDELSSASSGDTSYSNMEENLEESSEDSDTESSDYSDWVADTPGPNLEPPKRSKRKPLSRRRTLSHDDSSDETTEHPASTSAKAGRHNKRVLIPRPAANGEIPELYKPAEWLSEVIPRKTPYYPQMGDEVVYFRQGHLRYLDAVRAKKVYKVSHSSEPWNFRNLRDREFVRVIGIKYEIRPPRLCCLKLAMIDDDGNMTGTTFKIKYHDMPDVLDFLVLRQTFDLAVQRNWSIGDRFRCMIADGWWMGQIESRQVLSPEFPDSYFMCFRVCWDNGEYENMSPWDMEPIDENRLPDEIGGAVPVLPEEIRATLYQPKSEEWHRGDRDGSCRRIINGLEQLMRLSIAEHFLAPVDLNIYPDYAYLIEYPIDLTTIKSRFENHFYRRITSAQFDVRYLATNAEKYNRRHTNIVKHARIITDLCLRIIREPNDIDVAAVYHQLVDVYHSSESENDNESDVGPSTSTGPSTSAAAARARQTISTNRRSNRIRSDGDWRSDCRQLLELMWQRPDSLPFREPVDTIEFPDYLEIVSTPMDLRTVKEDLLGGNYADPLDFAKDVRLIFQNSKNYNTNKRSRIYSMTLRLSALFESHIKTVVTNWKAARRRANKNKNRGSSASGRGSSSPNKKLPGDRTRSAASGKRQQNRSTTTRRLPISDETSLNDEDDDDDDDEQPRGSNQRRGRAGGVVSAATTTSSSNRVTSSSSCRRSLNASGMVDGRTTAGIGRGVRKSRRVQNHNSDDDDDDDEDEDEIGVVNLVNGEIDEELENISPNSSTTDLDDEVDNDVEDDDDDEDDDDGNHGTTHEESSGSENSVSDNSEDSYSPGRKRPRKASSRRKHKSRSNRSNKRNSAKRRRVRLNNDSDKDQKTISAKRASGGRNSTLRSGGGTMSQLDESTQDTINHMPKRRGRQGRGAARQTEIPEDYDGPSTSARALLMHTSRNLRNSSNPNSNASAVDVGGSRGKRAAENDHSYHLPVRNGRIAESDTDSREVAVRPTRASVKRAIMEWAQGSDIDEDDDNCDDNATEDAEEILPTPTVSKSCVANTNTLGINGSSHTRPNVGRRLRTSRNTAAGRPSDSNHIVPREDNDSDDEPLAASQSSQHKSQGSTTSSAAPHPTHLLRRHNIAQNNRTVPPISRFMTRSHAISTTSNLPTSSVAPAAAHDHNYLGDGGPTTSSAAIRNNRRVLSRHQRNADELDISLDPLEHPAPFAGRVGLRRGTPTSTTSGNSVTPASAIQRHRHTAPINLRRGRSRFSAENSHTEPSADENQQNEEENDSTSAVGTDRVAEGEDGEDGAGGENGEDGEDGDGSGGGGDGGDGSAAINSSENVSDSEDNQPLTTYVPAKKRSNFRHSRRRLAAKNKRRHSDDSILLQADNAQRTVGRHRGVRNRFNRFHSRSQNRNTASGSVRRQRRQRGSRNQKRPLYNELSEEDDLSTTRSKRRRVRTGAASAAITNNTRNITDIEDEEANNISHIVDSEDDQVISVSSRGRVRKITAKARGIFKD